MKRVGVTSVSCVCLRLHTNCGIALICHQRLPAGRGPSTSGTDSRCRNDTVPVRRRICQSRQPVYQKARGPLSVNFLQHATSIRRLWEALAKWNHITRPAMLMSVPPRAAIAFSLSLDSLRWSVDPQAFSLCFPNCSRLPAPNRVPRSYRRD